MKEESECVTPSFTAPTLRVSKRRTEQIRRKCSIIISGSISAEISSIQSWGEWRSGESGHVYQITTQKTAPLCAPGTARVRVRSRPEQEITTADILGCAGDAAAQAAPAGGGGSSTRKSAWDRFGFLSFTRRHTTSHP